MKTETT